MTATCLKTWLPARGKKQKQFQPFGNHRSQPAPRIMKERLFGRGATRPMSCFYEATLLSMSLIIFLEYKCRAERETRPAEQGGGD